MILAIEARKAEHVLAIGDGDSIRRGRRQQQLAYCLGGVGVETLAHEGHRFARKVERLVGLPCTRVVGRARRAQAYDREHEHGDDGDVRKPGRDIIVKDNAHDGEEAENDIAYDEHDVARCFLYVHRPDSSVQ